MGSGHGYDTGGWWPPNTIGWNTSGLHELAVHSRPGISGGALTCIPPPALDSLTGPSRLRDRTVGLPATSTPLGILTAPSGRRTHDHLGRSGRV